MSDRLSHDERLEAAIEAMRVGSILAACKRLRYRVLASEVQILVRLNARNDEVFRRIETSQSVWTKSRIAFRRARRLFRGRR